MKIVSDFKKWWITLVVASVIVSVGTSASQDVADILGKLIGLLVMSAVVAFVPWLFYRLVGKPMTPVQFMSTYTVVWLFFVASQFITSCNN